MVKKRTRSQNQRNQTNQNHSRRDFLAAMAAGTVAVTIAPRHCVARSGLIPPSERIRVGAIGVMQVMPATGKELAVGDIRQLEANIHAGVKYMRFTEAVARSTASGTAITLEC